ncbi:mesothelin-like [Elgaria multicarinata webbii]|uniref:mesothelin-like n=1 Tax=Elgaria multicarinata webbii TaxID=159646 RepID=UPI002FCCCB03
MATHWERLGSGHHYQFKGDISSEHFNSVAGLLVTECEKLSPGILNSQEAVVLSVHWIETCISNSDVGSSLPSLSNVLGWNADQAEAFLSKLFSSGYQILDGQSLTTLGSLVIGLNSSSLEAVPAKAVLDAVKVPSFAEKLEAASPTLKTIFVEKLVAAVDGANDLVKHVPNGLVPYIPKSLLNFGDTFDIQNLSDKPWSSEQAAMFFDDVIKRVSDFNSLSPQILHGFTCAVVANMDDERFQQLTKALKQKNVQLREDQLSCLVKWIMLCGMPKDFNTYPKEVFLFISLADYAASGNCKEYITRVGEADIDILKKGSSQRTQLLSEGLACLNIHGIQVSKEDAELLGHLVCDLGVEYITASGKNLLKQLNQCQSFTPDQIKAIQAVLNSGNTPFGPPSKWSLSTLEKLSGLFHIFNDSILQNIPKSVLIPWLKHFIQSSHPPREQLASVVKCLQPSREKRSSAECPPDKAITEEMLKDALLPIYYDAKLLQMCLKDDLVRNNLHEFSYHAFTSNQLHVIKKKLDKMFPSGYPNSILRHLGVFLGLMGPEDIKKWNITSAATLASLLDILPNKRLATLIIQQYTNSGQPFDSHALNAIQSRYICLLNESQLNMIHENAIKMAIKLNPSRCPQTTKDILYPKAKWAFSDRQNDFPDYYNLIKPYLGAAPGEDLSALSKHGVNMDMKTFLSLRRDAVMELTANDVRGLLGINLPDLTTQLSNPVIRDWILQQKQSDLNSLGLGLNGGLPDGYVVLTRGSNRSSAAPFATFLHVFSTFLLTVLLTSYIS